MKRALLFLAPFVLSLGGCIVRDDYNTYPQPQLYEFSEDFYDNTNNWAFYDPSNGAEVTIAGGQLRYTYYPGASGSNTVAINTGSNLTGHFDITTSIKNNNAMGLVFGVSTSDYGYSFFIDPNGYFAVYDEGYAGHPPASLIDWTYNSAIHTGWNDLELEQVNGNWIGYCNGVQLFTMAAHQIYGTQVGFIVLDNTTGYADYLDVQWYQ